MYSCRSRKACTVANTPHGPPIMIEKKCKYMKHACTADAAVEACTVANTPHGPHRIIQKNANICNMHVQQMPQYKGLHCF